MGLAERSRCPAPASAGRDKVSLTEQEAEQLLAALLDLYRLAATKSGAALPEDGEWLRAFDREPGSALLKLAAKTRELVASL